MLFFKTTFITICPLGNKTQSYKQRCIKLIQCVRRRRALTMAVAGQRPDCATSWPPRLTHPGVPARLLRNTNSRISRRRDTRKDTRASLCEATKRAWLNRQNTASWPTQLQQPGTLTLFWRCDGEGSWERPDEGRKGQREEEAKRERQETRDRRQRGKQDRRKISLEYFLELWLSIICETRFKECDEHNSSPCDSCPSAHPTPPLPKKEKGSNAGTVASHEREDTRPHAHSLSLWSQGLQRPKALSGCGGLDCVLQSVQRACLSSHGHYTAHQPAVWR